MTDQVEYFLVNDLFTPQDSGEIPWHHKRLTTG